MTVRDRAKVSLTATVYHTATVADRALIEGHASVTRQAIVQHDAYIADRAIVADQALVEGSASVTGDALVIEDAYLGYAAEVGGDAVIGGQAVVLTGPFDTGTFSESPVQVVIGRFVVGVDADGALVGLPDHGLTRWEAYQLAHFQQAVEGMAYLTPEAYRTAMATEAQTQEQGTLDADPSDLSVTVADASPTVPQAKRARPLDNTEAPEARRERNLRVIRLKTPAA